MPAHQLSIKTNSHYSQQIEDNLFELGALSVSFTDSEDQPIFEPKLGTTPLWDKVTILAIFSDEPDLDIILSVLKNNQINIEILYPLRGEIRDRKEQVIATNIKVFDLY